MPNPFKPQPTPKAPPTKNELLSQAMREVVRLVTLTGDTVVDTDTKIKETIYGGGEDYTDKEFMAFITVVKPKVAGKVLTPELLQKMAESGKGYVNETWDNAIVDTVPQALIVHQDHPKYAQILALLAE